MDNLSSRIVFTYNIENYKDKVTSPMQTWHMFCLFMLYLMNKEDEAMVLCCIMSMFILYMTMCLVHTNS